MKEVLKKILALTLALVMVVGLAPAFELKAEATEAQATADPWTYDPATAGKTFDQLNGGFSAEYAADPGG